MEETNAASSDSDRRRTRAAGKAEREDPAAATGSLSRGLQIIDVLTQAAGFLSLSDVASETGLDASTAHRLLQTLTETGYAVRDNAQKRYLAGPRALSALSLFHPLTQVRREATPVLEMVQSQLRETCAFVLFLGHERLVVDFVRGKHPLSPYYDTWLRSPLHGSASGKLLLAWLPESERLELLGPGPYKAHTPKTIVEPSAFAVHLDTVRSRGYAVAREDAYQSLLAMGVPLAYQPNAQPLGCLVVTSASGSVSEAAEQEIAAKLQTAATLLMNSAPSMQAIRQWTARGGRRTPAPATFA
jgi:IclR family transcriptional regulator, acetate operon repressor